MRIVLSLLVLGLAGAAAPACAGDRIFTDGFEPCCTLGGEVSGLTGTGLVLHLAAAAISEDKPVTANGGEPRLYVFVNTAPTGTAYMATITTQPTGQTCTLSNGSGTMASTPVINIDATCVAGPSNMIWDDGYWDGANWQ